MQLAFIAQAGASGGGGGLLGFLPFVLILVIIYFLMLRPQMKKQKEHGAMLSSLKKNDGVVTSGGLHGRIVHINEKEGSLQIQLAKGIVVTVDRGSIARKMESREAEPPRQIPEKKRGEEKKEQKDPDSDRKKIETGDSRRGQSKKDESGVVTVGTDGGAGRKPRPRRRSRRSKRPPQTQSKNSSGNVSE